MAKWLASGFAYLYQVNGELLMQGRGAALSQTSNRDPLRREALISGLFGLNVYICNS